MVKLLRFTLRDYFWLVTCLALSIGWYTSSIHLTEKIASLQAKIEMSYQGFLLSWFEDFLREEGIQMKWRPATHSVALSSEKTGRSVSIGGDVVLKNMPQK